MAIFFTILREKSQKYSSYSKPHTTSCMRCLKYLFIDQQKEVLELIIHTQKVFEPTIVWEIIKYENLYEKLYKSI